MSHETAGELQRLIDRPVRATHITVPLERRVRAAPGLVVHRSDRVRGMRFPPGIVPQTWVEDTILDIAAAKDNCDDVYALVTRAFGRGLTGQGPMRTAMRSRQRLRWRAKSSGAQNRCAPSAGPPLIPAFPPLYAP